MPTRENHFRIEWLEGTPTEALARSVLEEYTHCRLCPWECGVDRVHGEIGRCRAPLEGEVFYSRLLWNEEWDLNPAYEVFFTGCNLSCRFCYLADKVRNLNARELPARPLLGHPMFFDPGMPWAKSLCAVGGEPATNLLAGVFLFAHTSAHKRVWNSNLYYSGIVAESVAEIADVVVADIHFGQNTCAERLGGVSHYLETVTENIIKAQRAGLEVIIRHLMLPGHHECCALPVVELVAQRFPELRFHILDQYLPPSPELAGPCPELCGRVSERDRDEILNTARARGLRVELSGARYQPPSAEWPQELPASCREDGEIIIAPDGRVIIPHLTIGLWKMVEALEEGDDARISTK